ncbi:PREDICTED: uncharacterized protein LOC109169242 [Ipomoea nil]|uniref:uncharacterized protein LOC109169242 n=1 Tax=Ipomoea nil TaxID=35883 RepID=UPI0009011793|nr:PREDICTED: uncharacterized protein LOC109169242 [Ipomoea nil]
MDRHCSNYAVVLFVILVSLNILNPAADGRELRPSEHGLGNQDSSSGNKSEILTFFGGSPESSELPEARNFTASLWNGVGGGGGRSIGGSSREGKKDDAIREVLFVASMVCGLTGVVLVVASAFLLVFRLRKRKSETTSLSEANVAQK